MNSRHAFTLIEILIVVAIIGLIAAVGVPLFIDAIDGSQNHSREINIEMVEAAKEQWAFENNKAPGSSVKWSDISGFMGSGITDQEDLDVDGTSITINNIGTTASY